ncbi:hypothetical protein PtA15_6A539 [Puccinia triticina]|uniref:CxC1-like cysteine cluster associated with KDZ transposases domain-containing protein n=1 Tax=Puccinia triticina TaxID=208348 RepID=A0ABY7CQ51_9BASI|nr:uncharacterized protein PtA15_6A539 [Puccinia triticina]WAQ85910.1 hypothetical protein PtA15_6A539 [Puccinia triticina]
MGSIYFNLPKCIAFTRSRTPCPETAEGNSKWCKKHEELQGKFMRLYKLHSRKLDSYTLENGYPGFQTPALDTALCRVENESLTHITNDMIPRLEDMNQIGDPDTLRAWYQIARRTWALANRAVLAREHHHSQFYQNGDHSHRHFNEILRRKQDLLESLMTGIDQRLYQLTIGVEDAEWLLSKQPKKYSKTDAESDGNSCGDSVVYGDVDCQEEQKFLESPPTPPSSPTPCEECQYISEDPDHKLNQRKKDLIGQLTNYLNLPPEDSEFPHLMIRELREVIINTMRILSDPHRLFVRAKEFNPTPELMSSSCSHGQNDWRAPQYQCPIKEFISGKNLSLKELQRLWRLMKFGKDKIGPELVRNAIADIYRCSPHACGDDKFRPTCANHKKSAKIWILGGFVWRKAEEGPLPRTGSDHLTFEEWAENRRLVAVGGRYPEWSEPHEPAIDTLFRCLRIVLSRHNCNAKLSKVEKVIPKSKKLRTVYTETQERHYLHLCMSVVDPRSAKIIDALSALPSTFNVYAKRRDTKEVTHKPKHEDDLWCSRIRSGYTTIERKTKRFTPATAFRIDSNLFEKNLISPEQSFKHRFDDCWDVLVMDAKVGSFDGFMTSIGKVILEVAGYESVEAVVKGEEKDDMLVQDSNLYNPNNQLHSAAHDLHSAQTSSLVVRRLRCYRSLFREPVCPDESSPRDSWY